MRVLFDTNVVLDAILGRRPHALVAARLMEYVRQGQIDGVLCATTVTTIYYFISQQFSETESREHIRTLLDMFHIAPVRTDILQDALTSNLPDYEDAVIHEAAQRVDVGGIVARDARGFRNSDIRIYAPDELFQSIAAQHGV